MKRLDARGLTLVELVLVSGVLVFLTVAVHETTRVQWASFRRESARVTTQQELRTWLGRMVSDVRQTGYDPQGVGGFGIVEFGDDVIRVTADVDRDGVLDPGPAEHLGYRLNGDVLERWLGGSAWRRVVSGVERLEMHYFDAAFEPVTLSARAVARVEIELTAAAESGGAAGVAPPVLRRRASAELRNDPF